MKKRISFICLISAVLLLAHSSVAQQTINFKTYTTADDLPYGTINQIREDRRGFIWLLAENGLTRFDGFDFIAYRNTKNRRGSLLSASVYNAYNGPGDQIFFQTSICISRYNYEDETFDNLIKYSGYKDVKWAGTFENTFYALVDSGLYAVRERNKPVQWTRLPDYITTNPKMRVQHLDGMLYISTGSAFYSVQLKTAKTKRLHLQQSDGTELMADQMISWFMFKNNKICYLSATGHYFRLEENTSIFRELPARASELDENRQSSGSELFYKGIIYTLLKSNKIIAYHLITGEKKEMNLGNVAGVPAGCNPFFISGNLNPENNLWIGLQASGVIRVDVKAFDPRHAQYYHTGNSNLKSNNFNAVSDADPSVVWLYSPGFGLVKGEKTDYLFQSYYTDSITTANIPTNEKNVRSLSGINDTTLFAGTLTSGNIIRLHPPFTFEKIIGKPVAAVITDRSNKQWYAVWGREALYLLDPETNELISAFPEQARSVATENFARTLWCGEDNSIYYVANGKEINRIYASRQQNGGWAFNKTTVALRPYKINSVFSITGFGKNVILLGSSNGLYQYNLTTHQLTRFRDDQPGARLFNTVDIRSVAYQQDGLLWVGTNGNGLFKFNTSTGECYNYSTETGLIDNSVYALLADRKKNIWASSNKGIFKLSPGTGLVQNFSFKDGLAFEEFNTNAATLLPGGKMAFGGTGGVVVFHPDSISKSVQMKEPVLLKFMANNQALPLRTSYALKYDQNYISIQFASLEHFRNDEFTYAYQLEGLDPDWIYCGKQRFTTYANLQPGEYLLKIKCTSYHGSWNDKILQIPLSVAKPWYRTWIFLALLLLTASAIIYGLFRMRLRQQTRLLLIRDSIARDLHDEIGANLSTISIYSEIAKENLVKNKENVTGLLEKISSYTQMSQESMSDIVWMIDSRNDKFENIIVKMRSLAAELIGTQADILLHLQIDENIHPYKISMGRRKNFYMIYKECLHNLVKYAGARNAWIRLHADDEFIILDIKDDGIGFDPALTKGNGLVYMKKRAAEIPGELSIQSTPGKGTSISLRFRH